MLPFSIDPFAALNAACVSTFGKSVPVSFFPQGGGGPITVNGIPKDPAILDSYGLTSSSMPALVHLFVTMATITPTPARGDVFAINGANYTMFELGTDVIGGTFLKMRRS